MNVKKPLIIAGIATTLGVSGMAGLGIASAHNGNSDSMADKIAAKFNLNKDEVQAVFDEKHAEREAEHKALQSERLQAAVESGDLTAEQKTLLEAKLTEMHEAMEAERDALEAWAEDNGIDAQYIMRGHGMRGGDRLDAAVEAGDITAEQKTAIEAKLEEFKDKHEETRTELEQWAEDNGIDTKFLRGMGGGHGRGGMRR